MNKKLTKNATWLRIQHLWQEKPLVIILCLAIITRLISAIFSKGFGMMDDHFLVIEPAQAWVDGVKVPGKGLVSGVEKIPEGHSIFYMGLHYLFFQLCSFLGFTDPQLKMLVVRLFHAFASVISVMLTYKIVERLSTKKDAVYSALLMTIYWFMPMLGVRNLVETFCFPFILYGIWLLLKGDSSKNITQILLAGVFLGLGISIRFQLAVFVGGVGLVLLIQKKWMQTLYLAVGVLLSFVAIQGFVDYLMWGYPFAEFTEYVRYNIGAAYDYIIGPWYNYVLLLAGMLIPPISLMLLFGFFASWRKQLMLFLPAFIFLLFHSIFPNKQERFILPIVPFIIMGGVIGWNQFISHSSYWLKHQKLLKGCYVFFLAINILLLIPTTVAYSKRSRVEVMSYLHTQENVTSIITEESYRDYVQMMPMYYAGKWVHNYYQGANDVLSFTPSDISFVLFIGDNNLQGRVDSMKVKLPELTFDKSFTPGFIDRVLYTLNPINKNETIYLYQNNPTKKE